MSFTKKHSSVANDGTYDKMIAVIEREKQSFSLLG